MPQEIIPPRKRQANARMRSLRTYMREMRAYREACDKGTISSTDAQRRVAMVQAEAETHMALHQLELIGQGGAIDVAPLPEEHVEEPRIKAHRTKKVAVKSGVDRHGGRIDEKSVTVESNYDPSAADGGHSDDDPEQIAEIEALT